MILGLLNSRPIFSNKSELITISDVLHPRISSAKSFDIFEDDLLAKDAVFKQIWTFFVEELVAGNLSKPGKTSFQKDPSITIGSLVMILFPSRNIWKYGKIEEIISKYRDKGQLKNGKTFQGHQVIDRANIIVLFTPKQTMNQT